MDTNTLQKATLIEKVIELREKELNEFRALQKDKLSTATKEDQDYNTINESPKEELMQDIQRRAGVADTLENEIRRLKTLDTSTVHDRIKLGSVVLTDKSNFVVGSAIIEFSLSEHTFRGVSEGSPILQSMLGKAQGDSFTFQNQTYNIATVI